MLEIYRLDHRKVDETKVLNEWSYALAMFLGPIYVLAHGFVTLALLMFLISLALTAVAVGVVLLIIVMVDSNALQTVVIVFVPLVMLFAQGYIGLELVVHGYMKLGWRHGY